MNFALHLSSPRGPRVTFGRPDPSHLDRLADIELQHGHASTAERLARLAAEMREAAQ